MLTLFETAAVIMLWNLVAMYSRQQDSVNVLLLYFQCLSLTQGFNVPWPNALNVLTTIMKVFNFNMDAISPACAKIPWSYTQSAWFSLCLPFIFGFFSLCKVLLGWMWMKGPRKRMMYGVTLSFFITDDEEFDDFCRETLSAWIHLCVILYNSLCVSFLQAFYCVDLPDGTSVLR